MNMKFKIKDERIRKRTNEVCAQLYIIIVSLTVIEGILKYIFLTQNIIDYTLEIIAIGGSVTYLLLRTIISRTPLFKNCDECIFEMQNKYRSHGFNICFFTYVFGEFILFFVFDKMEVASTYFPVWLIPAFIYTFKVTREGLFIWGSKRTKKSGVKSFKRNVVIGSIFFGIVIGKDSLFENGAFNPWGLLRVLGAAAGWGIPFYFMMKAIIGKSEIQADKNLKHVEYENKVDI